MPPPDKKYIDNAYAALKDNIDGFSKTPEEFSRLMTTDSAYRSRAYTALKENLDGFTKSPAEFDTAILGEQEKPVPYPESGMNATMGQFVKPEGTFDNQMPEQPDRKPFDQRIGQPVSGDIAATTPAPIDTKQKDDAIVVRKDAIVNTAKMKLGSKVDENSPAFKNEVKRLTGNHDKDLTVVTKNREGKPILGRNLNGWDSYLLGLRNNKKAQDEADNLMNASDNDAIKMLDAKAQESEYMKPVPNGMSGAFGETMGGMTRMIKNQGIGAAVGEVIAGAAAPETGGASLALIPLLTGAAATMPEFRKLAYAGELQKRYQQLVNEGKPKDEAYRLAKESAKGAGWLGTGEALAFSIAGQAANKILPAASETLRGANSSLKATIRSIAPEAVAQAGVSAASAAGKDLYARHVGIDVKNKDIVNDAIEGGSSAVQTLVLMGIMHAVANKVMEIPKYARSQIKNALSTVPKEQMQEVYKEIEANGLAGEGTGDQVIKDVEDFKKAKKPFESLPIEEENKAALAGKALQKQGLVEEKNNLEKHGEAFRGRIDELDKQIAAIEKQMAGMYDAKDVLGKEKDDLTGEKVKDQNNAESNTNENLVPEGTQTQSGDSREAPSHTSPEISDRRAQESIAWLEGIERGNSKEVGDAATELLGSPVFKEGQDNSILAGNDGNGQEVRAQGDNGENAGQETSDKGARSSQEQEHIRQLGVELGIDDALGTRDPSREGADAGADAAFSSIPQATREQVVATVRQLFDVRDNAEKTQIAGVVRRLLGEAKTQNEKDFITKNIEYRALQIQFAEKILQREPQETGISRSERRRVEPIVEGAAPAGESAPRQEGGTGDGKTGEIKSDIPQFEQDGMDILNKYGRERFRDWVHNQPMLGGFDGLKAIADKAGFRFPATHQQFEADMKKVGGIDKYMELFFGNFYGYMKKNPGYDLQADIAREHNKWQEAVKELKHLRENLTPADIKGYVSRAGYKAIKKGDKPMGKDISQHEGKYMKHTGSSLIIKTGEQIAHDAIDAKIKSLKEPPKPTAPPTTPKAPKERVFKVSTRQDKVNSLIDDVTAHNKLRKNSSERADVANKIRIAAKELGLKLVKGGSTGDLYLRSPNGKKVQRRFAGSGSAEVFDKTNYSPETHDLVKSHLDQEGGLLGLAVQGSDGRFLDEKQKAAALQDIRDGKDTARAKGVYDSMQSMVDGGHVEFRDNETGEITPVPVAEYLAEIKKEKNPTVESIEENYPSLWDDGQEDLFSETEQFTGGSTKEGAPKAGSEGDHKEADGEVQGEGTTTGTTAGKPVTEEQARQEKHYEEVAGAKPNTQTNRIAVDPIIGGAPKNLAQIVRDVTKGLVQKLFYARPGRRRAIGVYNSGNAGVKIKYNGDIDTTAHELGHSIDDKYGILKDLLTTPNPTLSAELKRFSDSGGSKPPKGHPDPAKYLRAEGLAEWLRAFVANPKQAIAEAPNLHKLYEAKVPAADRKIVKQFSDDFRTWAGATGADIQMANVEWEPEKTKGFLKKMFETRRSGELEFTWVNRLAANFVNPLHAFEKAWQYARDIKGLGEALPEEDTTILARLFLSVDMKAGEFLQHGLRDSRDQPLKDAKGNVKNLKWLMEPLDNADKKTIKQELKDASSYMIAERTIELADRFDREDIITGVGGGVYKDKDIAQKALDEFNLGDPKKLARIKEAAKRYREFANDVLQYLVDKGRLEQRVEDKDGNLIGGIDFIKENNVQYVALRRVMETEPDRQIEVFRSKGGSKLGSITEPITKVKGSTKTIVNPYISIMDNMFKSIREADRNEVMVAFRNVLVGNRTMYDKDIVRLADVGVSGSTKDKNTITIFVNGKPERWLFQEDVFKALKGLDNEGYKLHGALTFHARVLRGTVTKFPVFAIRNFIRDVPDRIIKSVDGSGLRDIVGDKEHWRDVARNGGLNSGLYVKDKAHYYGLLDQAMNDAAIKKNTIFADGNVLKKVWHGYEDILTKGETVNRVAEYRAAHRKAKEKGMDDYNASLYAAFRSRDLMDFALMGHHMKIINQVVPFSNAAVQGLRSAANSYKSNPTAFVSRMVIYTVLPQVAFWKMNHKDEQTAKEYEELPDYQRDMFYNMKIGANKWLSIPKPYELGLLAAGVDRTLSKVTGHNKTAFDGYAGEVLKTLSPLDETAVAIAFQPEIELMSNYNFFTGKPIIPQYEQPLDLTLRNTEYASRLGDAVQRVAGLDARKTDYWIKAHFSYWGDAVLRTSNIGHDTGIGFDITTTGLIRRTPAYNSKSVQDMLQFAGRWDMSRTPRFKQFKHLAHSYFDTKDDAQREVVARQMIAEAKAALAEWEPLQASGQLLSQQKAEAKKADK